MRAWTALLLGLAIPLAGCRDDSASATGSAGETESGTAGDDDADGDGGPVSCGADADCEGATGCMQAVCGSEGICVATEEKVLSNECRPQIEVDFPPRAATVEGQSGNQMVEVTGTVTTGAGDIRELTINGENVNVGADGRFTHTVSAQVGGNVLVLETADSFNQTRKVVQSYLWSTGYDKPTEPYDGVAAEGMGFYLGHNSLDDGDRTPPINSLADLFKLVLDDMDLSGLIDNTQPIASQAGYDIYLTDLRITSTSLALDAIDGGIHLTTSLDDIEGDLYFDCTNWQCVLAGGSGTGGISIAQVLLHADIMLSVEDNMLVVNMANVSASVNPDGINVWANNGWTNFLVSIVELFIKGSLASDLEATLENAVENEIGPSLVGGLSGLAINTSFEFPSLAGDDPILVDLVSDFQRTDFHDGDAPPDPSPPKGGAIILRAGGFQSVPTTPYDNLGIPRRDRCGQGGQEVFLPRVADLEIGLTDDLINQLLYSGWRGGLLEFPLDSEAIGDNALVSDVDILVSGMSAPTASDCNESEELLAQIGDIRIDASLTLGGAPVTFVAFVTVQLNLELGASEEGIGINITGVDNMWTEVTADDDNIELEPTLVGVLEGQLGSLLAGLGDGLGGIELPEFDLSESVGLPPGTAVLSIKVNEVQRLDGTTVVLGSF